MPRRAPPRRSRSSLAIAIAALVLVATSGEAPGRQTPKPAATEDNDGLPGATVGPSRKDLQDLIRAIGRDPVSDALVDRVEAIFRPRWATPGDFESVKKTAVDPVFLDKVDAAARAILKRPADAWTIINRASKTRAGEEEPLIREAIRLDAQGEAGDRKAIEGRIVDDDTGRPIVGAVVSTQGKFLARTDANGAYALKLSKPFIVNGNVPCFPITIEAPGHGLTQTGLNWDEMPETQTLDYRLPPAVLFGGRVVDAAGKPVAGAELLLYMRADPISRDGTMQKLGLGGAIQFRARTDARGDYAFRNIPPDIGPRQAAYNLTASHPKYQSRRKIYTQNEFLGPGWEITLDEGFTVRGRVIDEEGKPVVNAPLRVMSQPVTGTSPIATTDSDGRFRFDSLPDGPVQVLIRPVGYVSKRVEAKAEKGDPTEITIIAEKGDFFEGKVVDVGDKPVSGATVGYLQALDAGGVVRPNNGGTVSPNARAGQDGTFRLGPVAKGRYRVTAIYNHPEQGQTSGSVDVDSGAKDVTIKIGSGPGIH